MDNPAGSNQGTDQSPSQGSVPITRQPSPVAGKGEGQAGQSSSLSPDGSVQQGQTAVNPDSLSASRPQPGSPKPAQAPSLSTDQGQTGGQQVVPPWVSPSPSAGPPTSETPVPAEKPPQPATTVKQSPFKKLIPLVAIILVGVGLFFLITRVVLPWARKKQQDEGQVPTTQKETTLTYWGLWEPETVINPIIADYQKDNPGVKIEYSRHSYKDYRQRLQSALARDAGPDIFRFHSTWLVMLRKDLAPAPQAIAKEIGLEENFWPVISNNLQIESQVFGVPLGIDTLLLYYNPKILKEAGKTPPTTWDELRQTANDLTVFSEQGTIQTAGVALGTANNVDHFSDILGLMILQNGADLTQPSSQLAKDAIEFYTLLTSKDKVWSGTLPASTYAFATEKAAMMFGPSWRAHEIGQINPQLEFKTTVVPQLPGSQIAWANYWTEGVSSKSKNQKAAWQFLAYLSSKPVLEKMYNNAAKVRAFGEPYPRKDMADKLENDPVLGPVIKQAPFAQTWYMCSTTHDNGINDKIIKYYQDAINSIIKNESSLAKAAETLQKGINQVLVQYGLVSAPAQQ